MFAIPHHMTVFVCLLLYMCSSQDSHQKLEEAFKSATEKMLIHSRRAQQTNLQKRKWMKMQTKIVHQFCQSPTPSLGTAFVLSIHALSTHSCQKTFSSQANRLFNYAFKVPLRYSFNLLSTFSLWSFHYECTVFSPNKKKLFFFTRT